MNSGAGDTTQLVPGFPIRTPWDHSLVDSSPRPIAASHVLHRPPVPRHPPSALSNLTTKMLASTMQQSTNTQTPHHPTPPTTTPPRNNPDQNDLVWHTTWACHLKKPPPAVVVPSGPNRVPHPTAPTGAAGTSQRLRPTSNPAPTPRQVHGPPHRHTAAGAHKGNAP
jgi:hypothetical protein